MAKPMLPDDGKNLFDFMPGGRAVTDESIVRPDDGDNDLEMVERAIEAMRTVKDPEIPVNIYDLGLIYDIVAKRDGQVYVEMTLTTPNCPVAGSMPGQVADAVRSVPGVKDVKVKLVFTPPWTRDLMTEEAKLELGLL